MSPGRLFSLLPAACLVLLWGCAPRVPALPPGPGTPSPEFGAAYAEAIERCRGVRTFAGLLELSGRAGSTRLRSRMEAGFAAPDQARLELPAPFGRPVFILVANGDRATLVLPRDRRVLNDAPADAIVEALAGVALGAEDLRAVVAGCGLGAGEPAAGLSYGGGWLSVDGEDTRTWLRHVDGRWRVLVAVRGPLEVRYSDYDRLGRPATIHIRTTPPDAQNAADLTIRVSQVDINTQLGPEVFTVEVPDGAVPLSLEELRRAGPLGEG